MSAVEHVVDETGYSMKRRPVSGPKTANEEFLNLASSICTLSQVFGVQP